MLLLLLTLINVTIAHFGVTNTSKNMLRGATLNILWVRLFPFNKILLFIKKLAFDGGKWGDSQATPDC